MVKDNRPLLPPKNQMDWCDPENAPILAARIKDHWERQGYAVTTRLIRFGGKTPMRGIRSDMVSGLPYGYDIGVRHAR